MGFWDRLLKRRSEDWLIYQFRPSQIPNGVPSVRLKPKEDYANIWLNAARVVNVRSGFSKFYGVVHSYIRFTPAGQSESAEINTVIAPKSLKNVDAKNLDRVVMVNHRLLGPLPAPASDLEIEAGLFSIKSQDLVAPYLDILGNISSLAGVGFIKNALPFANPIKDGINSILNGQGESTLEVGLSTLFNPLETGFWLVMRVPRDQVDATQFKLNMDDGKVIGADGNLIKDYPYLVLEITGTKEKEDWHRIPELLQQYTLIREAVRRGDTKEANSGFDVFRRITLTCYELIPDDAERIVELVRAEIDRVLGAPTQHLMATQKDIPDLSSLPLYNRT